jgi:hypothetical protein
VKKEERREDLDMEGGKKRRHRVSKGGKKR